MKTAPIVPARIAFGDDGEPPQAPDFGDIYHPRVGAFEQARAVFLAGNGLPTRWQGRPRFVVFETGFGLGNNFLATWQAWRDDPARCERLVYVAVELHPPRREDLARAHQSSPAPTLAAALVAAWPPLTPNLHPLDFEDGRVQLLLGLGDAGALLPQLRFQADAIYLDGFAPDRNAELWSAALLKAVGRRAAPGATAATWSVARGLRDGLVTAGFEVERVPGIGGKRETLRALHRPRHAPRQRVTPPLGPAAGSPPRSALVLGAGIAGACAADALRRQGLSVTVLERAEAPALAASGNPAGLVHGTVNPDDGPYARLFRAAALEAARRYGPALAAGSAEGRLQGLLRLDPRPGALPRLQQAIAATGLPADYVQALETDAASARAGLPLASAAWFYPQGGWLAPATWIARVLAQDGIELRCATAVASLRAVDGPGGRRWQALDADGRLLVEAGVLVAACSASSARLLAPWLGGSGGWPLRATRGQVTVAEVPGDAPLLPLAGDGYALRLAGGTLLCGATREGAPVHAVDTDAGLRDEDHAHNRGRAERLTGLILPPMAALHGRAGWRLHTDDRLPIAGAVPAWTADGQAPTRRDQARWLPREPGLFVLTALGARGLTLAPLLSRLVAAQATGSPWPLEQDLADAVDPGRWQVRAVRQAGATARDRQAGSGGDEA